MFFWIMEKTLKCIKKTYVYSLTGHLITQRLIHNYQKSVLACGVLWLANEGVAC